MEHRNKPVLNPTTMNWQLPKAETDEQKILTHAVNFCKTLKAICPTHHLLRNVLSTIVYGRQELSGMDLSNLDFSHCNIGCPDSFKEEHKLADTVLNLPFYYGLSDKEMKKVVEVVNSIR